MHFICMYLFENDFYKSTFLFTELCNGMPYDPSNQVCCSGHLLVIHSPLATECCGVSSLYDPLTQKCCHNTVYNSTYECCGLNGFYNPVTQICCEGIPHTITPNSNPTCCGPVVITSGCEQCVNGIVVASYDQATHICCGGVVQLKIHHFSCCCGTQLFDAAHYSCCNGVVQQKEFNDTSNCCRTLL